MPTTTENTLLFNRLEIKYFVDRTTRTALTKDLMAFMPFDRHSDASGGYFVRSLYYDTADYMAYHEKLSGAAVRHKLRVRTYGADPSTAPHVRMEVKSRYLSFIHKIAVDVSQDEYAEIDRAINRRILPPMQIFDGKNISKEYFRILHQYNFAPKVIIQYRRQAFEKMELGRVRANFDDEIYASRDLSQFMQPLRGARRLLKYGHSIFEIKVDEAMPTWLHGLIQKYNLQSEAISKFCFAIRSEACFSAMGREEE
ncbi:MAG: VTC domain-containing protein [bacterium]